MNTDQKSVVYAMETSWVGVLPTFRALSDADKRDWLDFLIVKIRDLTPKPQTWVVRPLMEIRKSEQKKIMMLSKGKSPTVRVLVALGVLGICIANEIKNFDTICDGKGANHERE